MTRADSLDTGYRPRAQFVPYHMRTQRHALLVAHRRAGKTVACVNDQIDMAVRDQTGSGRYGYIMPFINQAKEVAWDYVKAYAAPIMVGKDEGDLIVRLRNGSRFRLYGADHPDRIRGGYLDGVTLDEYGDMKPSLWTDVVRPMLADRKGRATVIGTPKGRNDFYRMSERAKLDPEWFHAMLRASETGILDAGELAAARAEMDEEAYKREFECDFFAAIKGAIFGGQLSEAEIEGRIRLVKHDPRLPVTTAWDLGVGDSTAIWFAQQAAGETRLIDFYEASGVGLDHYADALRQRPYNYRSHILPHDVAVTELGSGKSRLETLRSMGVERVRVLPALRVEDGIAQARLMMATCWFDAKTCADGLEALRQYRYEYDERTRDLRQRPLHDWTSHAADAFRYLAIGLRTNAGREDRPRQRRQVDNYRYGR